MKKLFTERQIAGMVRFWAAAAAYYFIGWGTGLGAQTNIIDFVFFLGVGIGIAEMFIVKPIIIHMFNTDEGFYWRQKSVWQKAASRLLTVFRSMLMVFLIVLTYDAINIAAIRLLNLPADAVFLPGEPIMFGIFYILYYTLLTGMVRRFRYRVKES